MIETITTKLTESIGGGTKLLFKFCDRDECIKEDLESFHEIPIVQSNVRISFGAEPLSEPNHLQVSRRLRKEERHVIDGLRLYQKRYQLFDFTEWVISGKVQSSLASRALSLLQ